MPLIQNMRSREKHALFLRIVHWLNVPLVGLMVWSGLLIYWANDVYEPFFPAWFYEFFSIPFRLAEGLWIHFVVGWLLVFNGLAYLIWLVASGHWRELFPNRGTWRWVVPTLLHDLGLKKDKLPKEKFNAVQRLVYPGAIGVLVVGVFSGFAIYKPVQLNWFTGLFGGYETARMIHFYAMIAIVLFAALHVVQVVRAGWNNFRAMVAGFELEKNEDR